MASFKFKYSPFFLLIILQLSCNDNTKQELDNSEISNTNFSIDKQDECFIISIKEIYPNSGIGERYCLCPKGKNLKDADFTQEIEIPVERVGINSTTHLGFIHVLEKLNSIKAATNLSLYYNQGFNANINNGKVKSLGVSRIETELAINQELDVLFSYVMDATSYKEVQRLRKLGIPVILINEFMEERPIDKANWLKLFALFYGKAQQLKAKQYLDKTEKEYTELKEIAKSATNKPKVILGIPWKGNWYVSGANTYQANFIKDAGADYRWKDLVSKGSLPIAFEKVLVNSVDAEYWLNPGSYKTKKDILEVDERFEKMISYQHNSIYSHYKRTNNKGANDYWESGVVEPHAILADLIAIFHPSLLEKHQLKYYFRIDE